MAPPQVPPMRPKHFLLRVYSVKRDDRDGWEIRAEEGPSEHVTIASLFYHETDPHQLPPMDSIIHVLLDDRLTEAEDAEKA